MHKIGVIFDPALAILNSDSTKFLLLQKKQEDSLKNQQNLENWDLPSAA